MISRLSRGDLVTVELADGSRFHMVVGDGYATVRDDGTREPWERAVLYRHYPLAGIDEATPKGGA